jgi:RHS repeat-associated protein
MKKILYLILFFSFGAFNLNAQTDVKLTYLNQFDVRSTGTITLLPGFWVQQGFNFRAHIVDSAVTALPSSDRNYIATYTPKKAGVWGSIANPNGLDMAADIQYFDHLGRPDQEVSAWGSTSLRDIVTPHKYALSGQEEIKYLPYVEYPGFSSKPFGVGAYRTDAFASQRMYYNTPPRGYATSDGENSTYFPFAVSKSENSPLARLKEQGFPDETGQPLSPDLLYYNNGHTQKFEERSVSSIEGIVRLRANIDPATGARSLVRLGVYGDYPYLLSVKSVKDENWTTDKGQLGVSSEYTDADGHVILKRRSFNPGSLVAYADTYYVYDDFGNLCYVLPPKMEPTASNVASGGMIDDLCFQYRYDGRQRLIEKRIPGKGSEWTVYNKLDQVVASQDANQRGSGKWSFVKYDALGRTVLSGVISSTMDRVAYQDLINGQTSVLWENRDASSATGYSANVYPTANQTYLSMSYYDNYDFPGGNPYPDALAVRASGMPTGSKTNILGSTNYLWEVQYYDTKGRLAKNFKQHYKGGTISAGNYDVVTNTYGFMDEVLSADRRHMVNNAQSLKILMEYEYDNKKRPLKTWETINNTKVLLSSLQYHDLGQLTDKMYHSTDATGSKFLDTITYSYNIRGWQTNSYSQQFDHSLSYDYVGNINSFSFGSEYSGGRFNYTYDDLNRLLKAEYYRNGVADATMGEVIAYDKNGNITSLNRGGAGNGSLSYFYKSADMTNQLGTVNKNGVTFRTYMYDNNGNALSDGMGKGISYNMLNLPDVIKNANNQPIATYVYDAGGTKIRKTGDDGTWEYIDGVVYHNNVIEMVLTPEGKAMPEGSDFHFVYDLKDHLGNIRVSVDKDPVTQRSRPIQVDDYYAFGLHVTKFDSSNGNKYLYNGKELQEELGQYDYGARFYDPVIGRWNTVDPSSEKGGQESLTPYQYGMNNPVRYNDPDGRCPTCPIFWAIDIYQAAKYKVQSVFGLKTYADGMMEKANNQVQSQEPNYVKHVPQKTRAVIDKVRNVKANTKIIKGYGEMMGNASDAIGALMGGVQSTYSLTPKIVTTKEVSLLTTSEEKSIKSFENEITIHTEKLDQYKLDPFKFDNKGTLSNAPKSIQDKIIAGRIKKLEKEIQTFKDNIGKVKNN